MRVCLSHRILSLIETGLKNLVNSLEIYFFIGFSAEIATKKVLQYMESKLGGLGGAITVSKTGDIGIAFTSNRMAWAYQRGDSPFECGIDSPPKK